MSSARPASEPQLYSASDGQGDPEFARVLRTSDPGPALEGALTFQPAAGVTSADWLASWHEWRRVLFTPHLAPILLQTIDLAARGYAREMLACDHQLDAVLDPATRERSRAAGRRLLTRLAMSRGERWLAKFQTSVAADEMPAHFPVIYAGQHALFHLPLRLLVPAYAYWEWSAAMSVHPPVSGPALDFAVETDELCRLASGVLPSLPSAYVVDPLPAASSDR